MITEYRDKIAILRLNNGVTNPISPNLVDELSASLDAIKSQAHGMILCGGKKFFSIGLDLPELLKLERSAIATLHI